MEKKKTFFGRLLATVWGALGSIFKHVMTGAEKTFNELPEETKDALIHGSGVLDFINKNVGKLPEEIEAGLLETFPDLDVESLKTGFLALCKVWNIPVNEDTLPDIIAKIQAHISSFEGNTWKNIMNGAANLVAIFLAPAGTKFAAIASLMEYVYQTYFNKKENK
jgi:hypothetical protein